jgi:hypothetical protein
VVFSPARIVSRTIWQTCPTSGQSSYTGRVVKLRFFELAGDGRIGERWGAFVFHG